MKIAYDLNNPFDSRFESLGSIKLNDGSVIHLSQQAYANSNGSSTWYEAHAYLDGSDEPTHKVRWEIIDPDAEEEEYACDWDDFEIF